MKVTDAIKTFLGYQRLNSQKKYGPELWLRFKQVPGPIR